MEWRQSLQISSNFYSQENSSPNQFIHRKRFNSSMHQTDTDALRGQQSPLLAVEKKPRNDDRYEQTSASGMSTNISYSIRSDNENNQNDR